jgi:hypothetical protein
VSELGSVVWKGISPRAVSTVSVRLRTRLTGRVRGQRQNAVVV